MPIAEALALKAASAVLSFAVRELALDERIRKALGRDPTERAYARALARAAAEMDAAHPEWTAALFDESFFRLEAAPILARFLTRTGQPDPADLADVWVRSIGVYGDTRQLRVRELEPVALEFLESLEVALKDEKEFAEVFDQRASEKMLSDIAAIRQRIGAGAPTTGTKRDYFRWLIGRNLYLDPRGTLQTQRQVQLKLDAIYVTLRAQREEAAATVDRRIVERELLELEASLKAAGLSAEEIEDHRETLLARRHQSASAAPLTEVVPLSDLAGQYSHIVILGDPGSGKTTLLRYLGLKHAEALLENQTEVGDELGRARFPILIRIADYTETGAWRDRSLSDFVPAYLDRHECPAEAVERLIETELERGDCLVLLDGLDEVVDADDRRAVVTRIEDFVRRFESAGNQFIVTSRIAGYRSSPLTSPFVHYVVQDMDDAEIRSFLERWCLAVEDAETPDAPRDHRESVARREIDAILDAIATSPGVARLASNPLLLRVLALIHRTGARLPQKRIELYKLAADTLARTWRTAMGVPETALVREQNLTRLLGSVAFWLHSDKPTGLATRPELHAVLGEEWARMERRPWEPDDPDPAIHEEVEKFLLTVRVQTGLFVERAPNRFGFMHLTFEEYYASRHLVRLRRSAAVMIRERLHDPRWEEPILLALGFYGLDLPDESSELIETAILAYGDEADALGFGPSEHEDVLGRDFLFALRCLGDQIPLDVRVTTKLIQRAVDEFVDQQGSARYTRYSDQLLERFGGMAGGETGAIALSLTLERRDLSAAQLVRAATIVLLVGAPDVATRMVEKALHSEDPDVISSALTLARDLPDAPDALSARIAELIMEGNDADMSAAYAIAFGDVSPEIAADLAAWFLQREADEDFPSYPVARFTAASKGRLAALVNLAAAERSEAYLHGFLVGVAQQLSGEPGEPGTDEFVQALSPLFANAQTRQAALAACAVLASDSAAARARVLGALNASVVEDRVAVVEALSIATDDLSAVLRRALDDEDERVRVTAARRLLYLEADTGAWRVIADALTSSNAMVEAEALGAIAYAVDAPPLALLERVATTEGSTPHVAHNAELAIRRYVGMPEAQHLVSEIARRDVFLVSRAIDVILSLDPNDESAREFVASRLALDSESDVPHILGALDLIVRYSIPLGALRGRLYALSRSKNHEIAVAAIGLLAREEGAQPDLQTRLCQALVDAVAFRTRAQAAELLGQYAAASPELVDLLITRFREDDDNDVRAAAAKALASIGHRASDVAALVEESLCAIVVSDEFLVRDRWEHRTGQDYAFDALAMLLGGPTS